ncbi:hypothetical protein BBK82_35355 [Lentzea guizhouensis]|uniref:WD40 repeat domain-containing protein n=1 Tax=Lentzea guizhouensis TaxID=1586287 RepID=A0A1B2HRX0_9PSEU|nr:hypothetical protein BBK82_35355 [Lentzea guizhouensis]
MVTVEGRAVLVLPASSGDGGLVRAVDLDTGTLLPDRSLLRSERHEVLALGAGRLLATLGPRRDTVVVRDAVTGSPVGVPIREEQQTRSLTLGMADGRPVVVTTGAGMAIRYVETGALVSRHARIRGRYLVTFQDRLLLVAEESADSLRLHDVLTGEPFGHPLPCDFCMSVHRLSAVEHEGRLLVAFLDSHADTGVSLRDVTVGVELPTVPPFDDVRGISSAVVNGRPLLLVGRSGRSGPLVLWDPLTGREVLPACFAECGDWAGLELGGLDDGFFAVTVSGSAAEYAGHDAVVTGPRSRRARPIGRVTQWPARQGESGWESRQADFAPRLVRMCARITSAAVSASPSTIAWNSRVCSWAFKARSSSLGSTFRPCRR